jgi:hypothetical protein
MTQVFGSTGLVCSGSTPDTAVLCCPQPGNAVAKGLEEMAGLGMVVEAPATGIVVVCPLDDGCEKSDVAAMVLGMGGAAGLLIVIPLSLDLKVPLVHVLEKAPRCNTAGGQISWVSFFRLAGFFARLLTEADPVWLECDLCREEVAIVTVLPDPQFRIPMVPANNSSLQSA